MRNRICFDLWNEMSSLRDNDMLRNGTKGYFCEMFLDGEYNGLYCLSDKINRSLLGLKKTKLEKENVVKGVLYKCRGVAFTTNFLQLPDDCWPPAAIEQFRDWYLKYPKDNYSEECWEPLWELLNHTTEIGYSADSVADVMSYFYDDNLVEYAVFAMSCQLMDNFMHNSYLSVKDYTNSGKCWITPWDMDGSLGRDGSATKLNAVAQSSWVFQSAHPFRPYYDNQVQPFWDKYVKLWNELHKGPLASDNVFQLVDTYTRQIEQSGTWQRERQRWNGIYNFWHDSTIDLAESLKDEADYIKGWYFRNENGNNATLSGISNQSINANSTTSTRIYHIDGRPVNSKNLYALPHGIYIVNGKKVIK